MLPNSLDVNQTENPSGIVKSRVERFNAFEKGKKSLRERICKKICKKIVTRENLCKKLESILSEVKFYEDLLRYLLCSMPEHFRQVRKENVQLQTAKSCKKMKVE